MICWATEDSISRHNNPNQQKAPETLKNLLLRSSVPIVSPEVQAVVQKLEKMAPLKCPEITKFQKHIYIENRKFDHRLVKNNLLDKWPTADMNDYKERKDHRNLMESYVALFIILQSSKYYYCTATQHIYYFLIRITCL